MIPVGTRLRDKETGILVTVSHIDGDFVEYCGHGLEGYTHVDHISEFFDVP